MRRREGRRPNPSCNISSLWVTPRAARVPLSEDQLNELKGSYVFGLGPADRIDITVSQGSLQFTRPGTVGRGLVHLGDRVFHPIGAKAVRIRFTSAGSDIVLTVHDPDVVLTAQRSNP